MILNITCNALDGANMPGKKEAVSASAAKNAQNHMENNRYIQSELVLKQLFTYDSMQERDFHSIGMDTVDVKETQIILIFQSIINKSTLNQLTSDKKSKIDKNQYFILADFFTIFLQSL